MVVDALQPIDVDEGDDEAAIAPPCAVDLVGERTPADLASVQPGQVVETSMAQRLLQACPFASGISSVVRGALGGGLVPRPRDRVALGGRVISRSARRENVGPRNPLGGGRRPTYQVALGELDTQPTQRGRLIFRLHAFGDEMESAPQREVVETGRECLPKLVCLDAANEANVELRERRPQLEDVTKARIAGASVIDSDAHVAELPDRLAERRIVVDRDMLGQLEDESPAGRPDQLSEPTTALEHKNRRHIEGQERFFGEV